MNKKILGILGLAAYVPMLASSLVSAQAADPFATSSTSVDATTTTSSDPFATTVDKAVSKEAAKTTTTPAATTTTSNDPFATGTKKTTTTTTTTTVKKNESSDPFATGTKKTTPAKATTTTGTKLELASNVKVEGNITSDKTKSTLEVTVPANLLKTDVANATVQVQFCFVDGTNCLSDKIIAPSIASENKKSRVASIVTSKQLSEMKIITKDGGEAITLTKLPAKTEGTVKLYNTTVELGKYSSVKDGVKLTLTTDPAVLEYAFEAEAGKPFARIAIIDKVTGDKKFVPVKHVAKKKEVPAPVSGKTETPKKVETPVKKTETPKTTVEEVKKAKTGLGTNLLIVMAVLALASTATYGFVNKD